MKMRGIKSIFLNFLINGSLGLHWEPYGSGLNGKVVLPIRYFYVKVTDDIGEKIHGKDLLPELETSFVDKYGNYEKLKIESGVHWDGDLFFRYKVNIKGLVPKSAGWKFQLFHKSKKVLEHTFSSTLDEYSHCPVSYEEFEETFNCPVENKLLEQNFEPFKTIDLDNLLNSNLHTGSWVHYIIKDQKLYRKSLGKNDGFKMFSDFMLLSLLRKIKLPNTEFIFSTGDWPGSKDANNPLPIFSWCGSSKSFDIILPTWDILKHLSMGMGRARGDNTFIIQESGKNPAWEDKIPKAFFRGRDSSKSRLKAAELSLAFPDLIDAGLTQTFFREHDEGKWGPKKQRKSLQTHAEFKYQLLLDGTVAAFRAPGLFLQDSLILKEDSEYYEWWYPYLTANEHYLSITPDLSNLLDKLKWAKTNDYEAKLIAQKGSKLAQELFKPENVYCYYARALMMYSARQSRDVELTDEHTYIQFDPDAPPYALNKHGHCLETKHTEL